MSKLVFLTVREVCEITKIHRNTIMKIIKSGGLKASKIGGSYRILESDLQDYINKNRVGG